MPLTCDLVAADLSRPDPLGHQVADVLLSPAAGTAAQVAAQLADVLDRFPGCMVAAAADAGRCIVAVRGGPVIVLGGLAGTERQCALACGSLAYAWLCALRSRAGQAGPVIPVTGRPDQRGRNGRCG